MELGFRATAADRTVFVNNDGGIIIGLYMDDLVLASFSLESIAWVKRELGKRHQIKDLGEADMVVGIKIRRDRASRCLSIDQDAFLVKVLKDFVLLHARGAKNLAESCLLLTMGAVNEEAFDTSTYQRAVGCLMWAMVSTHPDMSFAVGKLSQHNHHPVMQRWRGAPQLFRYLNAARSYLVVYNGSSMSQIISHGDANYAVDLDD